MSHSSHGLPCLSPGQMGARPLRNICELNTDLKAFKDNSLSRLGGATRSMRTEWVLPAFSLSNPAGKEFGRAGIRGGDSG